MPDSRSRASKVPRCVGFMAVALTVLAPGIATADRHCYPALDAYFAVRFVLLAEGSSCPARLTEAADILDEALANAQICSCTALVEHLEGLTAVTRNETRGCLERSAVLLDAEAETKTTVSACH